MEGGGAPGKGPNLGQATSLPRERVKEFQHEAQRYMVAGQQPPVPHGQVRLAQLRLRRILYELVPTELALGLDLHISRIHKLRFSSDFNQIWASTHPTGVAC